MLKISKVLKLNIGEELGLKPNDEILAFDGFKVVDILDYLYYDSLTNFTMTVLSSQEEIDFQIEKDELESLGLEFYNDNLEIKNCQNKCVFCFVDQMPKGMRPSLYLKDDDYRQSFLRGNFITLTNVKDEELDRIIRLKLSPIYVSVQATDTEVRKKLLGNRFAGDILEKLKKLTCGGIKVHTQVVVVPGLNDGAILQKTCKELFSLGENLLSVAIVPCGITRFREGLYKIDDISSGYANCMLEQAKALNLEFNKNFVQPADEFYFRAGKEVESDEFYGDYAQIENGVGLTRKFSDELLEVVKKSKKGGKFLLITGTSASDFIKDSLNLVKKYAPNVNAKVLGVENEFFGSTVNCTGLLVGQDIIKSAKKALENEDFDGVILPNVCLKRDEDVFLDGVTIEQLKKELSKKIIITDGSALSFFDALTLGKNVRII